MREPIANLVNPVLDYGIALKDSLDNGAPDFRSAQKTLQALLHAPTSERDFIGDAQVNLADPTSRTDFFLGVRYALVCWLDEIFIADSPWRTEWTENKLEQAIFGTNDRAWKFWEQARRAETRPGSDALEVYFLAVMLGFRGEMRDRSEELARWTTATQGRIAKSQGREWPGPPAKDLVGDAAPRHGLERVQKMMLFLGAVLIPLIGVVAFFLINKASD